MKLTYHQHINNDGAQQLQDTEAGVDLCSDLLPKQPIFFCLSWIKLDNWLFCSEVNDFCHLVGYIKNLHSDIPASQQQGRRFIKPLIGLLALRMAAGAGRSVTGSENGRKPQQSSPLFHSLPAGSKQEVTVISTWSDCTHPTSSPSYACILNRTFQKVFHFPLSFLAITIDPVDRTVSVRPSLRSIILLELCMSFKARPQKPAPVTLQYHKDLFLF